ncbi:MAG: hypothetical protein BJ554DRAFT_7698, partial [Olpidium bornovanus]
ALIARSLALLRPLSLSAPSTPGAGGGEDLTAFPRRPRKLTGRLLPSRDSSALLRNSHVPARRCAFPPKVGCLALGNPTLSRTMDSPTPGLASLCSNGVACSLPSKQPASPIASLDA